MKKIFEILFYPWAAAHYWAAYSLFAQSDEYMKKFNWGGKSACVRHFRHYAIDEFMIEAFRRHWLRILFMPWTFQYHIDFDQEDM